MAGGILTRTAPTRVEFPFEALEPASASVKRALEREALRVNDRYLEEFLEKYAFCPYSREGRRKGQVHRYVHYCDSHDPESLIELMQEVAADPQQVVVQVIMPGIDVSPEDWIRFGKELTDYGHAKLGGPNVLACAPLHPALPYNTLNPEAMIPLFRRTPDPTIQWVRLDGLAAIYEGRGGDTVFVDVNSIGDYMEHVSPPVNLYERIAQTNAAMAKRMSFEVIEALLGSIATDARKSYARVLLEADPQTTPSGDADRVDVDHTPES